MTDDEKDSLKIYALGLCLQTVRDSDDITESGRLFQAQAAVTEKARWPIIDRTEIGMMSAVVER